MKGDGTWSLNTFIEMLIFLETKTNLEDLLRYTVMQLGFRTIMLFLNVTKVLSYELFYMDFVYIALLTEDSRQIDFCKDQTW